ncbi:hypothetical protein diail_11498 [Diaporthe ilicicola]|nr:hypothetical protein diail_11498 [Diaporthe ilicicola]
MNLKNIMSIHNFLLGIVTVAGLNIHPKPASAAAKHLNITLAPGAIDTLQAHDLWTPSAAGLNGIEPMFDDHFNATLENEKFKASGLDINSLIYIGVNDYNSKEATSMANAGGETGIANVDVDVCAP